MANVVLPKNLQDVTSDFEPLDPGSYEFEVRKVEEKKGKNSGKPYLNIELECLDEDYAGRRVFDIISLGEACLWRLKQFAEAADISIDTEFDTDDFEGETVTAVVEIEENEEYGERNRVREFK